MTTALNYIRNNQIQNKLTIFLMMAVLLCCLQFTSLTPVYSSDTETGTGSGAVTSTDTGGATTNTGGTITIDNWGDKSEQFALDVTDKIGKIVLAGSGGAILFGFGLLLLSKDPRKIEGWIHFLIKAAIVLFCVFLVTKGTSKIMIESLANKFG